jgi:glycosyltransferase involved in cell wall biosynthesis
MKILLMHQTVAKHDAIGNDIEAMYKILNAKHDCKVFAQNKFNDKLSYADENELDEIIKDKNNLIIYHHSVYWEYGEQVLKNSKSKVVIKYHNITPPEYFKPYNQFHFKQCEKGRKQTTRLANDLTDAFWLADSLYNAEDIKSVDGDRMAVCPPFNKTEEWAGNAPDEQILKNLLYSKDINLLFVGRVAPNKGHLFLIGIVHSYCINFGTDIKLRIIGKFDSGLSGYEQQIREKISSLGLENNIEFIGEINDSILISYYLGSDFFVCASEHEGFCVPIIEAQYFQLPIIARNATAVPETIGSNQIVLDEDVKKYAAAIKVLYENDSYKNYFRINGVRNYHDRFSYTQIAKRFKDIFREKIGVEL